MESWSPQTSTDILISTATLATALYVPAERVGKCLACVNCIKDKKRCDKGRPCPRCIGQGKVCAEWASEEVMGEEEEEEEEERKDPSDEATEDEEDEDEEEKKVWLKEPIKGTEEKGEESGEEKDGDEWQEEREAGGAHQGRKRQRQDTTIAPPRAKRSMPTRSSVHEDSALISLSSSDVFRPASRHDRPLFCSVKTEPSFSDYSTAIDVPSVGHSRSAPPWNSSSRRSTARSPSSTSPSVLHPSKAVPSRRPIPSPSTSLPLLPRLPTPTDGTCRPADSEYRTLAKQAMSLVIQLQQVLARAQQLGL